jgi:hypothetical protein
MAAVIPAPFLMVPCEYRDSAGTEKAVLLLIDTCETSIPRPTGEARQKRVYAGVGRLAATN